MQDKSAHVVKNWIIAALAILVIILLWKFRGNENVAFEKDERIESLKGQIEVLEHQSAKDKLKLINLNDQKDAELIAKETELEQYKRKPLKEKIKIVKVFEPGAEENDSMVCFSKSGIDSLGKYMIDCESTKRQLGLSDSIIVVQGGIIQRDSIVKFAKDSIIIIQDNTIVSQKREIKALKKVGKVKNWIIAVLAGYGLVRTL